MMKVRAMQKDKMETEKLQMKKKMASFRTKRAAEDILKRASEKKKQAAACRKFSKKHRNAPKKN